jgi:hypothetical protein
MYSNQAKSQALIRSICAMKGEARLAQSLGAQATEKIGFFKGFSTPPEAISRTSQKRDSQALSAPQKRGILSSLQRSSMSRLPMDLAPTSPASIDL